MLSSTYGEAALSERTCRELFYCFKNSDFDVEHRHSGGKEKIFEDSELKALFAEDSRQTHEELAEASGVTQQASSKHLTLLKVKRLKKIGTGELEKIEHFYLFQPVTLHPRNSIFFYLRTYPE